LVATWVEGAVGPETVLLRSMYGPGREDKLLSCGVGSGRPRFQCGVNLGGAGETGIADVGIGENKGQVGETQKNKRNIPRTSVGVGG
jgi:hypothetical protein